MASVANWLVRRALSVDRITRLPTAILRRLPLLGRMFRDSSLDGWNRPHPFDAEYGTDTGGYVAARDLRSGQASDPYITGYAGCAPSIVRKMLAQIPSPAACSFVDLGCGKGRALIVATEFGFRRVIGVELSPDLCRIAQTNAQTISAASPERAAIEIVNGDAVEYRMPPGPLAIFLYHPFHRILVQRLVERLQRLASDEPRPVHILYCNPACADIFDSAPGLTRVFAETLACDPAERGYAASDEEPVVIWRFAI